MITPVITSNKGPSRHLKGVITVKGVIRPVITGVICDHENFLLGLSQTYACNYISSLTVVKLVCCILQFELISVFLK